jgi:outer membrane protein assembly factor BamB
MWFDVQTGDAAPVPLNLLRGVPLAANDLLRDAFIVPAPGAVVVGMPTNRRAHLIGMS